MAVIVAYPPVWAAAAEAVGWAVGVVTAWFAAKAASDTIDVMMSESAEEADNAKQKAQEQATTDASACEACGGGDDGDGKKDNKDEPRTEPKNLEEKLSMDEAKGGAGQEIMKGKINDPRYPQSDWAKMEHIHRGPNNNTVIHYWKNRLTGSSHGFKFK